MALPLAHPVSHFPENTMDLSAITTFMNGTAMPPVMQHKLDADQYMAEDLDGVTENLFGTGNMNFLMMQQAQINTLAANDGESIASSTWDAASTGMASAAAFMPTLATTQNAGDFNTGLGDSIAAAKGITITPLSTNMQYDAAPAAETAINPITNEFVTPPATTPAISQSSAGLGISGRNGSDGNSTQGADGATGPAGANGNDGQNGNNGNNGDNGSDGNDGNDGNDGHNHGHCDHDCGGGTTIIDIDISLPAIPVICLPEIDVGDVVCTVTETVITIAETITETVTNTITEVVTLVPEVIDTVIDTVCLVPEILPPVIDLVGDITDTIGGLLDTGSDDTDIALDTGISILDQGIPLLPALPADIFLDPLEDLLGDIDLDISAGLNLLGDVAAPVIDAIPGGSLAQSVIADVTDSVLDTLIAPHADEIGNLLETVTDITNPLVNGTVDTANNLLGDLLTDDPQAALENLPGTITDVAGNLGDTVEGTLSALQGNLADGSIINDTVDVIESLLGLEDSTGTPLSTVTGTVENIVDGILNGSTQDSPVDVVTNIIDSVLGGGDDSDDCACPADIAGGLIGGLAATLTGTGALVIDTVSDAAASCDITDTINNLLCDPTEGLGTLIADDLLAPVTAITGALTSGGINLPLWPEAGPGLNLGGLLDNLAPDSGILPDPIGNIAEGLSALDLGGGGQGGGLFGGLGGLFG